MTLTTPAVRSAAGTGRDDLNVLGRCGVFRQFVPFDLKCLDELLFCPGGQTEFGPQDIVFSEHQVYDHFERFRPKTIIKILPGRQKNHLATVINTYVHAMFVML